MSQLVNHLPHHPLKTSPHDTVNQSDNEIRLIGSPATDTETLVFLHEGLGSVSAWGDFPARICETTGHAGVVYSRYGYGNSAPFESALSETFMHDAASVELPRMLRQLNIKQAVLIGHSDGASIALLHSALASSTRHKVSGVIAMAPHLFVEPICTQAIARLVESYETNPRLRTALSRHHQDVDLTFTSWTNAWLADSFTRWDIQPLIPAIQCPILAIQGKQDQYGTAAQLDRLSTLNPLAQCLLLDDCGHSPHVDAPDIVTAAIVRFIEYRIHMPRA